MKLIGFQIKNIKSISDSGWCHLSEEDKITVFAGQNEAGKSAILEGLNFFRNGASEEFERLSKRTDAAYPYIECEFKLEDLDLSQEDDLSLILGKIPTIKLFRGNPEKDAYSEILLSPDTEKLIDIEIEKIAKRKLENKTHQASGVETPEVNTTVDSIPELTDAEALKKTVLQHVLNHLPTFIYYDSFVNILPGTVQLNEIPEYPAILDLQKVFGIDFLDIVSKDPRTRSSAEFTLNKEATIDLNNYWTQKQTTTEDDKYTYYIKILPNTTDPNLSVIEFMIHRNDGIPLYIEQKSKGFQWFSSFNLRLKALGVDLKTEKKYVILIDEPGQGLHETAQADVKTVLEELAAKGMQIIYSTHNPCLIGVNDHEFLRIRLVNQTREEGTKIKNIAQYSSSEGSLDALSPVITAMGINSVGQFLDRTVPCVALEGITDHYYFSALKKLLGVAEDYSFIPAIGVNNIKPLISVLVGWGTKFKAIFDDGAGKKVYKDISKYLYGEDKNETNKHILKMDGFDGIEDLFSAADFDTYIIGAPRSDSKQKNSEIAKTMKKELLARLFLEKVNLAPEKTEEIKLSEETKSNFQQIFDWLKSN